MRRRRQLTFALAGLGAGALVRRSPAMRSLAMSGSSIAAPDAAGWVTDFLNAAYYARPPAIRSLDDLALAWAILTTRWARRGGRRLHLYDLVAFHRAFGRRRLAAWPFATLDRDDLLEGASRLLGEWFPGGWSDPARRGWGIVFRDEAEKRVFRPERRLAKAPLGPLTEPIKAGQVWHTYAAVPIRSREATLEALLDSRRWPDYGSALGRFTPLRSTGLERQTFEIEIVARPAPRAPVLVRAYVTVTRVLTSEQKGELSAFVEDLNRGLAGTTDSQPRAVPSGARAICGIQLTTHEGHVMGAARSNIVVFEDDGQAFIRDVGQWDPLLWHLKLAYRRVGAQAQQAFWGGGAPEESMLHQFAGA